MSAVGRTTPLAVAVALAGCVTARGPEALRAQVGRAFECELRQRAAMSMDTLALLLAPFPADVSRSMWHVHWFHAGTYDVGGGLGGPLAPDTLPLSRFELPAWKRQLYAREFPREVAAFIRRDGDAVREMAVLIYEGHELTIVQLVGRIDRFLEDKTGSDALLETIDALHTLFEHLGMAQLIFQNTADLHRRNEARVRSVLSESGWLPPPPRDGADVKETTDDEN